MPGKISIPDKEGYIIIITRKKSPSSNKSLGIQLTLTGNQDEQKITKEEACNHCFSRQQKTMKENCSSIDL